MGGINLKTCCGAILVLIILAGSVCDTFPQGEREKGGPPSAETSPIGSAASPRAFETVKISTTDSFLPQGETEIVADNAGHVTVVWMMGSPFNIYKLTFRSAFSTDGGKSYSPDREVAGQLRMADPALALGGDGKVYLGALRKNSVEWKDVSVILFRSSDFGRSWESPTMINDDHVFNDRDWIDVDAKGRVHAVWTLHIPNPEMFQPRMNVNYSLSTDGGRTFSPKIKVSDGGVVGGVSAAPDEIIYTAAQTAKGGYLFRKRNDKKEFETPLEFTTNNVSIAYSGGRESSKNPESHIETFPCLRTYTDPKNKTTVYVVWVGEEKNGNQGIYLARLLPGGVSFEAPRAIVTGPPRGFRLPVLAVDPKGNAHIFWIQKVSSENSWALFYAQSSGDKLSAPTQISPFAFPIEQWPGDFISATTNNTDLFVAWAAAGGPKKGIYVSTARGITLTSDPLPAEAQPAAIPVKEGAGSVASRLPNNSEIFGWIKDLVGFGYRRVGTEADLKAEQYIEQKFKEFGLEQVHLEPINVEVWNREKWGLTIDAGDQSHSIPSFPAPFSRFTTPEGVGAEMAYVGEGNEADYARTEVKGKIAVVDIRFRPMLMGQSKARSYFAYDPKNTIPQGYSHPAIRYAGSPNLQGAYQRAVEAGAAGVVGILQDVPANLYTFYTPYPNPQQFREPVPMMYVGRDDGAALRQQLRTKTVKARLINYGRTEPGVTHTVVGVLPGRSDDAILISSHHDSPFAGAVEDGSGISMVLALAKYFGQTPKEQRNKTLWFAAQAGHFYGSVGIRDFAQRHAQDLNPKLLVAVHLEHIAEEFVERNGKLADTGLPEPAFLFVSDNPVLLSAAKEAVVKHDLERTFIVRVTKGSRPYPGGESRFYFTKGVPVIGLASLPVYLLFEEDTLDKVAVERLAPTAAAMAEIVEKIDRTLKTSP